MKETKKLAVQFLSYIFLIIILIPIGFFAFKNFTKQSLEKTSIVSPIPDFLNVSQNATIEHFTTFSNYQRTGLVLSPGDKLYCQNYGTVSYSINVMGYEG